MSDSEAEPSPTGEGGTVLEGPGLLARWERIREREATVIGITAIVVAVFPWLFARAPFVSDVLLGYQSLATLILIWGIFAVGFDLLLGYTGLLSFGHAAFWGGAAYAAGIFSKSVSADPIAMVVVGTVFAVLFAWLLGFLSLRRGGIYFSILTLAFAQMVYYMATAPLSEWTNGENGLTGIEVAPLLGTFRLESELPGVAGELMGTWLYLFVGVVTVLSVAAAYRILNSPYGMVFRAVRENEQRAQFVGLDVWRYKLMAFVISGAFAGIAGSLFTIHGSYVPLQSLYWTESGEIVIIAVLGGTASLFGPILGAAVYLYVENIVSGIQTLQIPFTDIVLVDDFGTYWHLLLGLVFVVVIWFAPRGIWGAIRDVRAFVSDNADDVYSFVSDRLGGERL